MLYLGVGEGGPSSYGGESSSNQNAQNLKESWGKIHRMLDDGKVPSDNPILAGNINPTTIFSFGPCSDSQISPESVFSTNP